MPDFVEIHVHQDKQLGSNPVVAHILKFLEECQSLPSPPLFRFTFSTSRHLSLDTSTRQIQQVSFPVAWIARIIDQVPNHKLHMLRLDTVRLSGEINLMVQALKKQQKIKKLFFTDFHLDCRTEAEDSVALATAVSRLPNLTKIYSHFGGSVALVFPLMCLLAQSPTFGCLEVWPLRPSARCRDVRSSKQMGIRDFFLRLHSPLASLKKLDLNYLLKAEEVMYAAAMIENNCSLEEACLYLEEREDPPNEERSPQRRGQNQLKQFFPALRVNFTYRKLTLQGARLSHDDVDELMEIVESFHSALTDISVDVPPPNDAAFVEKHDRLLMFLSINRFLNDDASYSASEREWVEVLIASKERLSLIYKCLRKMPSLFG